MKPYLSFHGPARLEIFLIFCTPKIIFKYFFITKFTVELLKFMNSIRFSHKMPQKLLFQKLLLKKHVFREKVASPGPGRWNFGNWPGPWLIWLSVSSCCLVATHFLSQYKFAREVRCIVRKHRHSKMHSPGAPATRIVSKRPQISEIRDSKTAGAILSFFSKMLYTLAFYTFQTVWRACGAHFWEIVQVSLVENSN